MNIRNALLCIAASLASLPPVAQGQAYPSKAVRIIVPHPPGGPGDVPPRGFAQVLTQTFGKPFVVENRDGADGIIGAETCAKSAPDGHTLCFTSNAVMTINPFVHANLPYDPSRDFEPIIQTGLLYSVILAHPSLPYGSMKELLDAARAKPDSLAFGTFGSVSLGGLLVGWLKATQNVVFYQVPYKSAGQALQGAVAGDVKVVSYALGTGTTLAKNGKMKAMAVNSPARTPALPDAPTLKELDLDFGFSSWFGFFAPAGTPPEVVRRIHADVAVALAEPQFKAKFITAQGFETDYPVGAPPRDFAAFLKGDREKFARLAKTVGLKAQ